MNPVYDVAVILVGLDAKHFVLGCLRTLEAAVWRDVSYQVIYVDNGSADGTVEDVRSACAGVKVIENEMNVGFCPAANQGARASRRRD